MGQTHKLVIFTLAILALVLAVLSFRLVKLIFKRIKSASSNPSRGRDLLMDTLRDQMLREREALRDKRESDQAFEALNALHRTIMEHLPIGLIVLDGEARLGFANARMKQWFSQSEVEAIALAEISETLLETFNALRAQTLPAEAGLRLQISGSPKHFNAALTSLPEARFLLTLTDKTKERELEDRLRYKRDLELMGEMASGITHEVKNALAVIQGHAQLLSIGNAKEHQDNILVETERLLSFVKKFMQSSRNEEINIETIIVAEWFEELRWSWMPRPFGNRLLVKVPEDRNIIIRGDRVLLTTVLFNLILNGIQACENTRAPTPWVRLEAWCEPGHTAISVQDRGGGFPAEIEAKLFVPFVSSKKDGTGLGLFQCRKIMMAHQARLELSPGAPTRWICHFPKTAPEPTTPNADTSG